MPDPGSSKATESRDMSERRLLARPLKDDSGLVKVIGTGKRPPEPAEVRRYQRAIYVPNHKPGLHAHVPDCPRDSSRGRCIACPSTARVTCL